MVFNATFNNISVISWRSVLLVRKQHTHRKPPTFRKSLTNLLQNVLSSTPRHELTTLLMIDTDCTGSRKANYQMITTKMSPVVVGCDSICSVNHLLSLRVVVLHCLAFVFCILILSKLVVLNTKDQRFVFEMSKCLNVSVSELSQ